MISFLLFHTITHWDDFTYFFTFYCEKSVEKIVFLPSTNEVSFVITEKDLIIFYSIF